MNLATSPMVRALLPNVLLGSLKFDDPGVAKFL